ncbi:MAG: Carbamoyltransferase HypF [Acidimicrobiales bacterium]|nr:MAG: carbamoyltransferase HypF [Actinomycetota bacterium]MBV6510517.1 Carbamoyltransferase HypF [Acidimicrobiales bacterium]RIK07134.1 MAG: carbamoyltransferase HypF [Acidobacteriota bacterium]
MTPSPRRTARRIRLDGVVQGVGFRPFVWRLARDHDLSGWVRNTGGRVEIFAEGEQGDVEVFCAALVERAPPLARIDHVEISADTPIDAQGFRVDSSIDVGHPDGRLVAPDSAPCGDCRRELWERTDRRYLYPFVNCTQCGPRFTIIEDLPYDRERTVMRRFRLCAECAHEYDNPADRRFHAEPVACPRCGPTATLLVDDARVAAATTFEEAARLLCRGHIIAIKGVGGYQLACVADDETAVTELRRRKDRPHKPLAVMVPTLAEAQRLFDTGPEHDRLLSAPAAPIVLVPDRGLLAPSVAPGHNRQGVMLPASPLHELLCRVTGRPLVMTSGNRSEEPIAIDDADARARLGEIADAFLVHDRPIATRFDDSVALAHHDGPRILRRARGYAPEPIVLPVSLDPVLACGADLQTTFCLAQGTNAYVSQHIGDLDNSETIDAYHDALQRHLRLFRVEPRLVAHDLHPDLESTHLAVAIAEALGLPRRPVQHHHGHIAAAMVEHGLIGPVVGVALDGFGLGTDGTAWGFELLVADLAGARRAGHLRPVRQPGGDAAVRHPSRMALAHAADAECVEPAMSLLGLSQDEPSADLAGASPGQVLGQLRSGLASALTSSAGRLFDSVAALADVSRRPSYEGQPAVLLEQLARRCPRGSSGSYPLTSRGEDPVIIDSRPVISAVVSDLVDGRDRTEVAAAFHAWVSDAVVQTSERICEREGITQVCLGGGVWANAILLDAVTSGLGAMGIDVFYPRAVPPGDGGLSLGQAVVAHADHQR